MNLILHITTREAWERGKAAGAYRADSLATEGFIHCSAPDQVLGPAQRFFADRDDLLLLLVDADRLRSEVRVERAFDVEQDFPHVYGPLDLDAVVDAVEFGRNEAGEFVLPAAVWRHTTG